MLGPDARIVEAGRDRVRLQDLAVLVLEDRGQRAVQHALAAGAERGAVAAAVEALARRLDADQLDLLVAEERHEGADRVAAAADAGDHAVGQAARSLLEHLSARLVADHALEVAHQRRVRRRADGRADHVVSGRDVRDPVADRRADRLLQRPRAGLDRLDPRAQQPHPLDVGPLAAHVLGAHVDDALEARAARRRSRSRRRAGRRRSRRSPAACPSAGPAAPGRGRC